MTDKVQLSIIIVLLCACAGGIFYTFQKPNQPTDKTIETETQKQATLNNQISAEVVEPLKLYNLINGLRNEADLNELKIQPLLEKSAQLKLKNMIDEEYWRHEDTQNVQSWYLFTQAGYDYTIAGENLAFGLNTAWDVFNGWVDSPRHKQELLTADYQDMGLAIDCQTYKQAGKPSCIVVLHLGAN